MTTVSTQVLALGSNGHRNVIAVSLPLYDNDEVISSRSASLLDYILDLSAELAELADRSGLYRLGSLLDDVKREAETIMAIAGSLVSTGALAQVGIAPEAYGQNLRRIRKLKGLTQTEAADRMGTTKNLYAKLEHGTRRLHSDWIDRAAHAFGIDPGEIFRSPNRSQLTCGDVVGSGDVRFSRSPNVGRGLIDTLANKSECLGPTYIGWIINIRQRTQDEAALEDGRLYVVSVASKLLLRQVWRSQSQEPQRYHLFCANQAPAFTQEAIILFNVIGLEQPQRLE